MPIGLPDFIQGVDFTLYVTQTAAMHNLLVSGGTPSADRGLFVVSNDTALNTPVVPDPTISSSYTKLKLYGWVRRPHSTASNTTPILYLWNDNKISIATYLKWERSAADTTAVEALIAALDLRVDDLESTQASLISQVGVANSLANAANIAATAALSTANAANANATTALSDLNTPTTGVKDRLTAVETVNTSQTGSINTINSQITTINTTLGSGLGPIFIAPTLIATSTAGGTIAWTSSGVVVPTAAKAVILQIDVTGGTVGTSIKTVSVRPSSASSTYVALKSIGYTGGMAMCGAVGGAFDYKVDDTNAGAGYVATVQLIGYYL